MFRKEFLIHIQDNSHCFDKNKIEDEHLLLYLSRPIKERDVSRIPENKFESFIDKVLEEKNSNKIIYSANSEKEVKKIKKSKSSLRVMENPNSVKRNFSIEMSGKCSKDDIIQQAQESIDFEKKFNSAVKSELSKKNEMFYNNIIEEQKESVSPNQKVQNEVFKRIYYNITKKKKEVKFPNIKLNHEDVYSRLYHNVVLTKSVKTSLKIGNNPNIKKFTSNSTIKENIGKEFTSKLNQTQLERVFMRNSGGPNNRKKENLTHKSVKSNPSNSIIYEGQNSYLHDAVSKGNYKMIEYLLDKGLDPNSVDRDGNTPLHLLCLIRGNSEEKLKIYRLLIKYGSDKKIRNKDGLTPLDYCSEEFHIIAEFKPLI